MRLRLFTVLLLLLAGSELPAQQIPRSSFTDFVKANEKFGRKLLAELHAAAPERNIVVSPLPVSLSFAPLEEQAVNVRASEEIRAAFGWQQASGKSIPSRMLMARLRKPRSTAKVPESSLSPALRILAQQTPEELWASSVFLYRDQGVISQTFVERIREDFGLQAVGVDPSGKEDDILDQTWDPAAPRPKTIGPNHFWITSATHLRTAWAGNTFIAGHRTIDFHLSSGQSKQVEAMKGELNVYRYSKTEKFEAIVLPCYNADLIVVMPGAGQSMDTLAKELTDDAEFLDSVLKREMGRVDLPAFSFRFDTDLRAPLLQMGVRKVFDDPSSLLHLAPSTGARLTGVLQRVDISVDERGIRADAGTILHGALGGILQGRVEPFHMVVNRPFLFLIRDAATDSLLFAGIVMDPTLH